MRRRFRTARRRTWIIWGLVLLLFGFRLLQWQLEPTIPESLDPGDYQVERIVDGDTLLLANGARVRLIGADTPETVGPNDPVEPWGPQAAAFTEAFVRDGGSRVRLEFDRERVDRYGRFLAYVWVGERMLNEELIEAGLARARLEFRYSASMKRLFERAEQEARRQRRGIWSNDSGTLQHAA